MTLALNRGYRPPRHPIGAMHLLAKRGIELGHRIRKTEKNKFLAERGGDPQIMILGCDREELGPESRREAPEKGRAGG